jgi:ABC-type sulfate transport system permease component
MKSQYIKIIRTQEQIIKSLEKTVVLSFLAGLSLGVFISVLTYTLLK